MTGMTTIPPPADAGPTTGELHPGILPQARAPRILLFQPRFWAAMAVLTAIMFAGALALSEHLKTQREPVTPAGPLYYAAQL